MFRSSRYICFNTCFRYFLTNRVNDILNEFFPLTTLLLHQVDNAIILLGIQISEAYVLHLPLDRGHPKPVGNRTENLERLLSDPTLVFLGLEFQRTHIMKTVS